MAIIDLHHLLSFIAAEPLPHQSHDPIFLIAAESPSTPAIVIGFAGVPASSPGFHSNLGI
ncbi:hypothetical protein SLEP1_g38142 [Rubroshorea leprosula]|uniref:Uncharacterized protein n=1 Tax=Rubroshorea leprosula TaxID=152421 RepID=A0AAV5KWZ6_9ROSI|nr:hypothetical protein SLEP1_g38142 [Rubroshorea leprosula]